MTGGIPIIYLFDCDELTNFFQRNDFNELWNDFVGMVEAGKIRTLDQVFCELEKFPPVYAKYKALRSKMRLTPEEQYDKLVTDRMSSIEIITPKLINFMGRIGPCDPADPWLVAVAAEKRWRLVSHEKRKGDGISKSIFTACKALGVKCISLNQFLEETGLIVESKSRSGSS